MSHDEEDDLRRQLREESRPLQALVDGDWGVADIPQLIDLVCVDRFLGEPEDAAAMCDDLCATCYEPAEASAEQRLARCLYFRCGLRDPQRRELERAWVANALVTVWRKGPQQEETLRQFHQVVALAGVATAGLRIAEDGSLRRQSFSATLRGRIHIALVNLIAAFGGDPGDVPPVARKGSVKEATKAARRKREADKQLQGFIAAFLEGQGLSLAEIADQIGINRDTVRVRANDFYAWRSRQENLRKNDRFS